MIYRTQLTKEQIKEVSDALLVHKLKEKTVDLCLKESIGSRDSTFKALNPDRYNGKNVIHRNVLDAAVRLLKLHNVHFEWAKFENVHFAESI